MLDEKIDPPVALGAMPANADEGHHAEGVQHYLNRLKQQGIQELGRGDSAVVFAHPTHPEVAVKVANKDEGNAYAWLEWCAANPSAFVPRVHSLHDVTLQGLVLCSYYIAFMEMLAPANEAEVLAFIHQNGLGLALSASRDDKGLAQWDINPEALSTVTNLELRSALSAIHGLTELSFCDMALRNFMTRQGQVVFADPVPY